MSVGLIALLDDVAAIAKAAAASVDDVAGQAMKAGAKSAGVVIDDAAVTPRYVVGLAAARELPIVAKIARGSLFNKLVILLPAALALAAFAPWAITPLLMLGGAYLCYEGAEKVFELVFPHKAHAHEAEAAGAPVDATALENAKVSGAVRTDFILSAEIMAIALAAIPEAGFWSRAVILALVGTGITALVYGGGRADREGRRHRGGPGGQPARRRPRRPRPGDRARAGQGHARLPARARRGRHRGDDLGRGRHRAARHGELRIRRPRPCHP